MEVGKEVGRGGQKLMELYLDKGNNRMQKRTLHQPEREKSHDLLHSLLNSKEQDNFIRNLKAHKISEKYRVLEQKLHRTSKSNIFRQVSTLNRKLLKQSNHLVKHQNKVEANIELHRVHKLRNNFTIEAFNRQLTAPKYENDHNESFFTPKTREQIVTRHGRWRDYHKVSLSHFKKESNISIKVATETSPTCKTLQKGKWRYKTHGSTHLERQKQNISKKSTLHSVDFHAFETKCNSISTVSHSSSQLFPKEKPQSANLEEQNEGTINQISGFTRHQLFSYFQSLITFSANNENKYIAGFETMLNLMNISSNQTTIRQFLTTFMANPTFQEFINVFQRVVESSLKETVVDYFQIVLDGKWSRQLCFDELVQLLSDRMSSYHAKQIVDQVYYQLDKNKDRRVSVQEIVGLCYKSQQFCGFMRGYSHEIQRKGVSQRPKKKLAS